MGLYLKQLEIGPMRNFQYLIGDTEARTCWMVDPAWEAEKVYDAALKDGYSVEGILISHAHFDHVNDVGKILARKDMPVYVQRRELEYMERGAPTELFPGLPKGNLKPVSPGDKATLGGVTLTFLHTPGHTPGSQCFLLEGGLVSGDTLFLTTCGRVDLPGGNPYELYDTLNGAVSKLPGGLTLFPGHNYSSHGATAPLSDVRKNNRYFHAHSLEEFLGMLGF